MNFWALFFATAGLCVLAVIAGRLGRIEHDLRPVQLPPPRVTRIHVTPCQWGASSVGPVTIQNGHVTGSTTPHTTGCTP